MLIHPETIYNFRQTLLKHDSFALITEKPKIYGNFIQ